VLDAAQPSAIYTAATAAVRDAEDGAAFVAEVERETGLRLRILSGQEEARYSALGVIAGYPDADGVVGDLGGSSLELIRVRDGRAGDGVTLPLGPFSLGAPKNFDAGKVRALASRRLERAADGFRADVFHAVGGAWRALALIHMDLHRYPLKIVHEYEMSARDAQEIARFVAKQSKGSLERIQGISKKRVETLPWAAMVVDTLIEQLGFKRLVISAYGIREGLLFEAMPADLRGLDPLIQGNAALGARQGAAEALGPALADWLKPAFAGLPPVFSPERDAVLTAAASRLADVGARLHPDHRADLAFAQVLRAPVAGQSHAERVFLAVAVHARYGGQSQTPEPEVVDRLLTDERFARARALGLAMRLGCDLSGRTPALLAASALRLQRDRLVLTADPEWADMLLGEQTTKRAGALAQALGLDLVAKAA
jgi:exopolyphosphatase/guanosine-5'-triphosphate,3'-diphosphate pyrophosphatase